jgi:ParB family chromosome partitioning protein
MEGIMSKSPKRLGRGLDSLVTNLRPTASQTGPETTAPAKPGAGPPAAPATPRVGDAAGLPAEIAINGLVPNPFQPRSAVTEESLASLAESLAGSGMIQPISVRRHGGRLEIIAGERRWHAARMAGMETVPVVVREADDRRMLEMALVENIQREDLNAVDRARAYRQYCDDFGASAEALARRLGEDRSTVTNYLRLLELPDEIGQLLAVGRISMGHARCLVGVTDREAQLHLARVVVANELSVRALEEVVRRAKRGQARGDQASRAPREKTPNLADLEQRCSVAVSTKVTIHEGRRKGSGRIVIEYYSLDDFDRIVDRLGVVRD